MKHTIKMWTLCLIFSVQAPLIAISMVYNFRVAQITREPINEDTQDKNTTLLALLFDQFLQKHTDMHQNYGGGLASFIYHFFNGSCFFRADCAISHIQECTDGCTTFSGTQTDDLLFTLGKSSWLNKRNLVTLSGLFGVPTHAVTRLQHADFGYAEVGLGAQVDGLHTLYHANNGLLYGARYIYLVPRHAHDITGNTYKFTAGNLVDILFAYKDRWGKHGFELGFTERFHFGAQCTPTFDDIVKKTDYIRSSFYGVYKYRFTINEVNNRLLLNIAYGFDEKPKKYGNKYIIIVWGSWSVNF